MFMYFLSCLIIDVAGNLIINKCIYPHGYNFSVTPLYNIPHVHMHTYRAKQNTVYANNDY